MKFASLRRSGLIVPLLAALSMAVSAADRSPPVCKAAGSGTLLLQVERSSIEQLGLRFEPALPEWHYTLLPEAGFRVELGDGAPTGLAGEGLLVKGLSLQRSDGARTPPLHINAGAQGLDAYLVDAQGDVWMQLQQGMRSPERAHGLRLFTGDLRVGPALAEWLGLSQAGSLLAGVRLDLPLQTEIAAEKSCAAPNWPGTKGFVADVLLVDVDGVTAVRCRSADAPSERCDGPGGAEGEVVVASLATLANSSAENASEVPWYQQFSAPQPPYANDQHPFLVWNLYRLDSDGELQQIARSALKHAFATANTGCVDQTCTGNGWSQILGRGCADLYSVASQECGRFLAPRSEVIPSTGVWGRCGSLFDANCDGFPDPRIGHPTPAFCSPVQGSPSESGYGLRLVAAESAIDPDQHPDARWFLDAWYVVRDDANLFNTMGYRELFPTFDPPTSSAPQWRFDLAPYQTGDLLQAWVNLPGGHQHHYQLLDTAEGQVGLGVRVTRLVDGRYRYDYTLMNFSLTRPVLDGAEPDLRVLSNLGLAGFSVPIIEPETATTAGFSDGDSVAVNDWSALLESGEVHWSAPTGVELAWGSLASFSLIDRRPPALGQTRLHLAQAGAPSFYSIGALIPDVDWLFGDGFD